MLYELILIKRFLKMGALIYIILKKIVNDIENWRNTFDFRKEL